MRADYQHEGPKPWRGMKRDAWEGGHRVPFIVRWPGRVKPSTTSDELISLTDIMATISRHPGAELPHNAAEDSFNMLPLLEGRSIVPIRPYYSLRQLAGFARSLFFAGQLEIHRSRWLGGKQLRDG